LQTKTYEDICDPASSPFFDPSWGFQGVRFDGDIKTRLKLGLAAVRVAQNTVLPPLAVIQVEPGDTPGGKITEYARRFNLLLNVSPDGYVCLYRPNDKQDPLYSIRNNDNDPLNNVLDAELMEDAKTLWTETIVVGEQIAYEGSQDPNNPNATKKRGKVVHEGALPFLHRNTVADGEMYENGLAQKYAEWVYKRGIFDAWYANYTLLEHHQNGYWWESNTMASLSDDEFGLIGNFYVQAVRCQGSKQGADITQVTIRKPGLLSAFIENYPNPGIYYANNQTGAPVAK
jgi:prophage tail gpP-like protein